MQEDYLREYKDNVDHLVEWCQDITKVLANLNQGLLELQDTIDVFFQENEDEEPSDLEKYLIDYAEAMNTFEEMNAKGPGFDDYAGESADDDAAPKVIGLQLLMIILIRLIIIRMNNDNY